MGATLPAYWASCWNCFSWWVSAPIRVADSGSGTYFFDPWIRDGKNPDPGSGMNIPDNFLESSKTGFGLKYYNSSMRIRIRDRKIWIWYPVWTSRIRNAGASDAVELFNYLVRICLTNQVLDPTLKLGQVKLFCFLTLLKVHNGDAPRLVDSVSDPDLIWSVDTESGSWSSLDVLYRGLGISKLQFFIQKI